MAGENAELRCHTEQMKSFRLTASGAKTKGDVELQNDLIVFWLDDVADGVLGAVCYGADKAVLPTTSGLVVNAGDRVYWNNTAKKITKTATDHAVGWGVSRDDNAGVASANGDTDCWIDLTQEVESSTY
jgi:hypothetical protein